MTTPESRTVEERLQDARANLIYRLHTGGGSVTGRVEDVDELIAAAKEHGLVIGEEELDRAWKEAEEALPEDYTLELKSNGRTAYFAASLPPFLPYEQWFAARREAFGLSPAEALQGLVERLREIPEESRR